MKRNPVHRTSPKASPGVSQQFEFINLLNKPQVTDVGTKKAVRAHAMRDFRRRRGESYHNRRVNGSSSIRPTDRPSPSSNIEHDRNGLALDPPVWMLAMESAEDTSPVADTAYYLQDLRVSHDRDGGVTDAEVAFHSETASYQMNAADGGDELGAIISPESPRKRKKFQENQDSPVTWTDDVDGDGHWSPNSLVSGFGSDMTVASPKMIKTPGAGSPDPFNALPIVCTRRVHILMHHYISVFVRSGSQMIPRETWINEALNDSALFQATLLPSAAHYALFYDGDLAESFHLFDQTTQTVYRRLGDPEQGTSDATLAAVICLSFVENVLGNSAASSVHMNGLHRMVELRGGLQALGFKGVLQRMVLWADNWTGILALSPPRFPLAKQTRRNSNFSATDLNISRLKSALQDDCSGTCVVSADSGDDQDDVFGIIFGLQQLSRTLAAIHANKTTVTEALQFNERVFLLERQLLLSLVSDEQPRGLPLEIFILRCFSHAAYIYIYSTLHSTLRDLPLKFPFFGIFVERLQAALDQPEFFLAWCSTSPVMLLWVLVVGAIAAHRRPQRSWFLTQLTSVCIPLKISDFQKLRGLLEEMMWVSGALDSSLTTLWSELQTWTPCCLSEF